MNIQEAETPEDFQPLCVRAMGCLCAGHACCLDDSAPCDTSEETHFGAHDCYAHPDVFGD